MDKTLCALLAAIAAVAMTGCSTEKPSKGSSSISESSTVENSIIERQAKSSVSSVLFNQQTYFLEKKVFATSFDALKEEGTINTKNYSYRIALKPDKFKGVAVTATSKNPKLRSYTGVVYALKGGQSGNITLSQLCETKEPSKVAPLVPASPKLAAKRAANMIACPAGSRSAFDLLASSDG
jgi:hypothetical protein